MKSLDEALNDFYREQLKPTEDYGDGTPYCSKVKPHASDALAVHPAQVEQAKAKAKKRGVPTEFLPDGRPIMRSRAHQKEYLKKVEAELKLYNKDGGYGD